MKNDILKEREGLSCCADFLTITPLQSLPNVNFRRFVNKTNNVGTALSSIPDLDSFWVRVALSPCLLFLPDGHGCLSPGAPGPSHYWHPITAIVTMMPHLPVNPILSQAAEISINLIKIQLYHPQVFRNFKYKVNFHIQRTITIS